MNLPTDCIALKIIMSYYLPLIEDPWLPKFLTIVHIIPWTFNKTLVCGKCRLHPILIHWQPDKGYCIQWKTNYVQVFNFQMVLNMPKLVCLFQLYHNEKWNLASIQAFIQLTDSILFVRIFCNYTCSFMCAADPYTCMWYTYSYMHTILTINLKCQIQVTNL